MLWESAHLDVQIEFRYAHSNNYGKFKRMSDNPITLNLSDDLYQRLAEVAESSNRSLENVLLESLDLMFGEEPGAATSLDALKQYSDAELWAVVHRRLPWSQSLRLHELNDRARDRSLLDNEQQELDQLLGRVDEDMLLRSEALMLLQERGKDVTSFFK